MTDIFRFRENQPVTWYRKSKAQSNQHCLYCSAFVGVGSEVGSNREHLIGREFVPKGAFDGGQKFNFIFRACEHCNGKKADFERHVSTVTLFRSPARAEDERIDARAAHKAAHDYHPDKKGVRVQDAGGQHDVQLGQIFTFGLVSPPQLKGEYVKQLALHHVQGLFSLLTSADPRDPQSTRLLPPNQCWILGYYTHQDWGNPQLREGSNRTADWPCYANVSTADGYFRAIMKRDEDQDTGWFWALEWNKSVRVCGAIAKTEEIPSLFADLPDVGWKVLKADEHETQRFRQEVPITEKEDVLFAATVVGPA